MSLLLLLILFFLSTFTTDNPLESQNLQLGTLKNPQRWSILPAFPSLPNYENSPSSLPHQLPPGRQHYSNGVPSPMMIMEKHVIGVSKRRWICHRSSPEFTIQVYQCSWFTLSSTLPSSLVFSIFFHSTDLLLHWIGFTSVAARRCRSSSLPPLNPHYFLLAERRCNLLREEEDHTRLSEWRR